MKSLCLLLILGSTACVHTSLDDTYGMNFNAVFAAQNAQRQSREVAPMKGEEARRIIGAYYEGFSDDGTPGSGGGGAANASGAGRSTPGGAPAFQIKAR